MTIEINAKTTPVLPARPVFDAMLHGFRGECPACHRGALFAKFLKVADHCPVCGEALHHQRADDAPPYFTMLIVGHVMVGGILLVEQTFRPEMWVQLSLWVPATIVLSLLLLPRIKGALIGLQWANRMHGFGSEAATADRSDPAAAAVRAMGGRTTKLQPGHPMDTQH